VQTACQCAEANGSGGIVFVDEEFERTIVERVMTMPQKKSVEPRPLREPPPRGE